MGYQGLGPQGLPGCSGWRGPPTQKKPKPYVGPTWVFSNMVGLSGWGLGVGRLQGLL